MSKRRPPSQRPRSRQQDSTAEPEDAFIGRILGLTMWARKNTQALILGGVILALIIAGSVYYLNFRATTSAEAIAELSQIQQVVAVGETEQAKTALTDFLSRYDNTRQAAEARLLLGEIHLEEGDSAAAIEVLEPAARSLRNPVGIQAAALLGAAYEEDGRLEEAEEAYLRVADRAELPFQVEDALSAAARIRVQREDYAGAEALYERLIETMDANDPSRGIYEMRLAEIAARRRS